MLTMNKTQKTRHYLKVTPRDIELFKYLFIYKGAIAKQISIEIFLTPFHDKACMQGLRNSTLMAL